VEVVVWGTGRRKASCRCSSLAGLTRAEAASPSCVHHFLVLPSSFPFPSYPRSLPLLPPHRYSSASPFPAV